MVVVAVVSAFRAAAAEVVSASVPMAMTTFVLVFVIWMPVSAAATLLTPAAPAVVQFAVTPAMFWALISATSADGVEDVVVNVVVAPVGPVMVTVIPPVRASAVPPSFATVMGG